MSDITYAPLTDQTASVTSRLQALRGKIAAWLWLYGLSRVLSCAIGLFALDLAIDWFFRMDRPQRVVMLLLMLGVLAYMVYRKLVLPLSATASDDALCLQVEARHKQLGQSLISALQLARMDDVESRGMSPEMVRRTVRDGTDAAAGLDFGSVLDAQKFRANGVFTALAVAGLLAIGVGAGTSEVLATWFDRNILLGERTWPQNTYLEVQRAKDGRVIFPRGEDWTQIVEVKPESKVIPDAVYIDFRRARGRAAQAMKKVIDQERQFEAVFASVIEPFEFRARGGDAVTPWISVELVDQPAVETLTLEVTPPKYTRQAVQTLPAGKGPYYVLKGGSLAIRGTANKPLVLASLRIDDKSLPLELAGSTNFSGAIPADRLVAGQYTFDLEDTLGLTSRRPTTFGLRIRADREPRVRARLIGVSGMVVPNARVPLSCRISDDFGVTSVSVPYQWRGDDAVRADGNGALGFEQLKDKLGSGEITFDDALELEPLKIPTGTGLNFHIAAADNDDVGGPNVGKSSDFLLRIVTAEELRTDILRREKEQRQELERLIKSQEDVLTDTRALEAGVKGSPALAAEHKDQLMQYQRRQKQIGTSVAAIAERLAGIVVEVQNNRLEAAGGRLQTRLQTDIVAPLADIAAGGVPLAMQKLDQTRRQSAELAPRDAALTEAVQTQQEIVTRMKQILLHMTDTEGYQEAVNLLYEIQKMQQDVLDRTLKEKQERIKGILEGKP